MRRDRLYAQARKGFTTLELMAILTGAPLCGFTRVEAQDVMRPGGVSFPAITMVMLIASTTGSFPPLRGGPPGIIGAFLAY